jgi:hypothetical protein
MQQNTTFWIENWAGRSTVEGFTRTIAPDVGLFSAPIQISTTVFIPLQTQYPSEEEDQLVIRSTSYSRRLQLAIRPEYFGIGQLGWSYSLAQCWIAREWERLWRSVRPRSMERARSKAV